MKETKTFFDLEKVFYAGDDTPIYPFVFGGAGLLAIALALVIGRKRRANGNK